MQKRWIQSIFIFIVIIVFTVIGYLFLKKYDAIDDVAKQTDPFIFTQEVVKLLDEFEYEAESLQ